MKPKFILIAVLAALVTLLSGCMSTVDQMYCLPKRSEAFQSLQTAMDRAMEGLQYSAPLAGENQQTVQAADLNGDGKAEYIVFAKGNEDRPMRVLIFTEENGDYVLSSTIARNGSSFEQVEYVQMDGQPGLEMVVGCQVSDQVLRSVGVYRFDGE